MAGFVIKIEGLQETLKRLSMKNFEGPIQTAFDNFGENTATEAKQFAPVDESLLKNSIFFEKAFLAAIVGCSVNYAAYVEFGTRKFAAAEVSSLPATWQQLAAKSKGKAGGTFAELVLRITEWVRRKGLGTGFAGDIGVTGTFSTKTRKRTGSVSVQDKQNKQAAYLIARKIVRDGVPSQPYLRPAVNIMTIQLLKELKAIQI